MEPKRFILSESCNRANNNQSPRAIIEFINGNNEGGVLVLYL
ncbi:MAG: hypothetical protein AABZ13_06645 [Planctomycetota bacterium]